MKTPTHKTNSLLKYFVIFLFGMSVLYFASAYTSINTSLTNATQYIQKIILTSDGTQSGTTGIILDGSNGNIISAGLVSRGTGVVANGVYSTAIGREAKSYGLSSVSIGEYAIASGAASISMGNSAIAYGHMSTAIGPSADAIGDYSIAIGFHTISNGNYSTAIGYQAISNGGTSTAIGQMTTANGDASTAIGSHTIASGEVSTAMGYYTIANGPYSTAIGTFNVGLSNSIFEIGIGYGQRSNALTVLNDGKVGIGTTGPTALLDVNGTAKFQTVCIGGDCKSAWPEGGSSSGSSYRTLNPSADGIKYMSGDIETRGFIGRGPGGNSAGEYSTAIGGFSIAMGQSSMAMGLGATSIGISATAIGNGPTANGNYSIAMGNSRANGISAISIGDNNEANGDYSIAMGRYSLASGELSTAMGSNTQANGEYSTAIGSYTRSNGYSSTSLGGSTTANGNFSTSMGVNTVSEGYASTSIGGETIANGPYSTAIGRSNIGLSNSVFEIGIGSNIERINAMTVLNNGNVGIGVNNPSTKLQVIGDMKVQSENYNDGIGIFTDTTATNLQRLYGWGNISREIGELYGKDGIFSLGTTTNSAVSLFANNIETIFLSTNNKVGIGTNVPTAKLDVNGGIKPIKATSDPCSDTSNYAEGTMFYNDNSDYYCFCDATTTAKQMHAPATSCF